MANEVQHPADGALARVIDAVHARFVALPGDDHGGYVGSELPALDRALARIRAEQLAEGPLFCDWGSGLGEVCAVAALHGFEPVGIEIQRELVDSARSLATELELPLVFAVGSFLQPGDEDLALESGHTELRFDASAWRELDLAPGDCNVVFAYPWPSEEAFLERVFQRHASAGTLLVTYHDGDHVLVQRKVEDGQELHTLGWM